MPDAPELVVGPGLAPADDELRLPRPPGVIRTFWARHPVLTDALIALLALLLTLPALLIGVEMVTEDGAAVRGWPAAIATVLFLLTCVGLLWRRRWPVLVLAASIVPVVMLEPVLSELGNGAATTIAVYSVAVYRNTRTALAASAGAVVVVTAATAAWAGATGVTPTTWSTPIFTAVTVVIAVLIGINVGNRRRYLEALIDRSRQLLIERDQQAQLAAAAERTRIAREMHDIVSHSLTVIIALADGAQATRDPERARAVTQTIAATGRDALRQMRGMLGVLRADDESSSAPLTPRLTPHDGALRASIAAAQAAGFPVTLTVTGPPGDLDETTRLALARIVQEGVTNAMRHSEGATYIRAAIAYTPDGVRVGVRNDGVRGRAGTGGYGLAGIRERVAHAGGTIRVGPLTHEGPGGVWALEAELPVRASEGGADD
ncbi:sensor histidine kinase [Microbacterium sp.]|uniref:sensor histidine kinase n=1 Tax=Microbacterium sp. TaxID=51671 RepID=UPI0039E6AD35